MYVCMYVHRYMYPINYLYTLFVCLCGHTECKRYDMFIYMYVMYVVTCTDAASALRKEQISPGLMADMTRPICLVRM